MLRPPAVCLGATRRRAHGGLTLVELLVVIAIITTLAAIAFGIVQGVRQYAAAARARSDLAVLSQTLEQYRHQFGDYPQTADSPDKLFQALSGRLGPGGAPAHGHSLVVGVTVGLRNPDRPDAIGNYFVDPWGNAYQYVYFTRQDGTAPVQRGYVLFSFGQRSLTEKLPTRAEVVPTTSGSQGGAISSAAINAKNVYAGR